MYLLALRLFACFGEVFFYSPVYLRQEAGFVLHLTALTYPAYPMIVVDLVIVGFSIRNAKWTFNSLRSQVQCQVRGFRS